MKLKDRLGAEFLRGIDMNLRYFCKKIRESLRDEKDCVIAITGYPGVGKSNDASIIGVLIDFNYSFSNNVCFIPTSDQIGKKYLSLPMFSVLHIDEASRGLDKKRWYDKIQQKLNELYDSVSKDNEICFYDKNDFKRMTSEKMFNIYGENPKDIKIFVIDDKFNVSLKSLNKILQRPIRTPTKRMFRIKTRFNKETIVTEDHSIFIFKNKGERMVEVKPKELKIGDKVILPKFLPSIESIKEDNDKMQLFGAWLADGNYRRENSIQLSGGEHEEILKKISSKFPNENKSCSRCYKTVDFILNNRNLVKEMKSSGFIGNTYTKRVPSWIFNTTKENKISFLKGFFTGDGSINFEGRARASSVNKELLRDIQILLNMLGIPSGIVYENRENSFNGIKSGTHSYHLEIPTLFHNEYIKFFEPTKKNYELLKNFIPSKGKMNNKRKEKYIKNDCICAAIIEIEEVKEYKGNVYDLSVEGVHRFISNDILHKNTEREGHFLCTLLLMPRFQNFTENFRNFRIKYWVNLIERGYCIVYRRDEDPHVKDPWHMDENYKLKEKMWRGRKILDRDLASIIKMEQKSKNYWFWFRIPKIPENIWSDYQQLKRDSRIITIDEKKETAQEKSYKMRMEKLIKLQKLIKEKLTKPQMAIALGVSLNTLSSYLREAEALLLQPANNKLILNHPKEDRFKEIPKEFDKIEEM
jgi:intein/homing endonuclease